MQKPADACAEEEYGALLYPSRLAVLENEELVEDKAVQYASDIGQKVADVLLYGEVAQEKEYDDGHEGIDDTHEPVFDDEKRLAPCPIFHFVGLDG